MRRPALVAPLLLLILAACEGPFGFVDPISEPGMVAVDTSLAGTWVAQIVEDRPVLRSEPSQPPETFVLSIEVDPHDPFTLKCWINVPPAYQDDWELYDASAHASLVSNRIYYNVRLGKSFYAIAQAVQTEDGELAIMVMRDSALKSLIANERIWPIEGRGFGRQLLVREGGPGLAELLRDIPDDELFVELARFERLEVSRPGRIRFSIALDWVSSV